MKKNTMLKRVVNLLWASLECLVFFNEGGRDVSFADPEERKIDHRVLGLRMQLGVKKW